MSIAQGKHHPLWPTSTPYPWAATVSKPDVSGHLWLRQRAAPSIVPESSSALDSLCLPQALESRHTQILMEAFQIGPAAVRVTWCSWNHLAVLGNITRHFSCCFMVRSAPCLVSCHRLVIEYMDLRSLIHRMEKMTPCMYSQIEYTAWSVWKNSSHRWYNENSLCKVSVTWRPRRVDWKAYVWTMTTSLY